jgi:hypothetical protein
MEPTIHKYTGNRHYTKVSNALIQNKELSWKARGLLAYILSLPDNWEIHVSFLSDQSPNGKESVKSAIKELKALGYLHLETIKDSKSGKIVTTRWTAFDDPADNKNLPQLLMVENQRPETRSPVLPEAGNPVAGEPATTKEIQKERKLHDIADAEAPVIEDIPFPMSETIELIKSSNLDLREPSKPRPRDQIWDALCKFQGYALDEKLNKVATGKIARAKKLILETNPEVTAEEIAARGTRCRAAWTGNDVMRLASDWSRWGTGAPQNAQNGRYGSKGLAPIR